MSFLEFNSYYLGGEKSVTTNTLLKDYPPEDVRIIAFYVIE